jgi:Sperm-tail PG-rich repeat
VPGPGTYKDKHRSSNVGGIIGDGPRLAKDFSTRKIVPGPGAYNAHNPKSLVGATIGDEIRFTYAESGVPGPGSYKF